MGPERQPSYDFPEGVTRKETSHGKPRRDRLSGRRGKNSDKDIHSDEKSIGAAAEGKRARTQHLYVSSSEKDACMGKGRGRTTREEVGFRISIQGEKKKKVHLEGEGACSIFKKNQVGVRQK